MPADTDADGDFGFAQAPLLSDDTTQRLLDTAEEIAGKAVQGLNQLLGCDVALNGEDACTSQFVETFGKRVYRRPLEGAEKDELVALADQLKGTGYSLQDRIRVVLTAMLQTPAFLYRWEQGTATPHLAGQVIQLGPYELASRLSYFLWSSAPDDALLNAAAAGKLDGDAGLDDEIWRMLKTDKFQRSVESFHEQWLSLGKLAGTSKDPTLFPEFTATLKSAMSQETLRFVDDLFTQGTGRLSDLFGSKSSFVNADLAKIYGVSGVTGSDFRKVALDPSERAGILTQASFLTTISNPGSTNPPRAGHTLYTNFLCNQIPAAPPGAAAQFKPDADPVDAPEFQHARDHERLQGMSFDSESARLRVRELRRGRALSHPRGYEQGGCVGGSHHQRREPSLRQRGRAGLSTRDRSRRAVLSHAQMVSVRARAH